MWPDCSAPSRLPAPDLQVAHGDLEAGTEFGKVTDGGQSFFRDFRQILAGLVGEVGIGMTGGAAYTATELMKLGKTETVSVFNDKGVGIGDIQAGFDDGGAYQNLDLTFRHGLHYIAQSIFSHLTMSNGHTQTGNPLF